MYSFLKFILFKFKPEIAHHLTFFLLKIPGISIFASLLFQKKHTKLKRNVFGLEFKNPTKTSRFKKLFRRDIS